MNTTSISVLDAPTPSSLPIGGPAGIRVDRPAGLVFVGGQISAGPTGEVIGREDLEAQLRNVFENIWRVLRDAGVGWRDVVRMDVYYVPDDETVFWDTLTRVAANFIEGSGPVWTAVQVPGLAYPGLLVEIDAVAVARNG
ncbi:Rid family hydrolase [Segeticoccus rhizosphaerae]|uniref:Rid family hydrolase n=1 Tax=Segeticoccus rhizosphaerae TaxID=1104777 RepID=UPI001264F4DB|nr:Rid family hydrolase [Segeticoccus rhizosphaerae]